VTDIVKDGETGLLVPERDPGALAAAVERLADDQSFAERLASNGYAWVRERFAPDRVAAEFLELYRRTRIESEGHP
jgi:glycosyltransferase involved in cell wall biosynthesis